jgi:glycosyltransferase involved in cell wall biosynthesis
MPQREPVISVVLPNYNHGRYIKRAIDALLAQDFTPDEILVVDDASTDDSRAILEKIALASPRVRVFENEKNEGFVRAQQRALAVAKGKYISLAAADDWVLPGFFSLAVETLESCPQAGLFTGDSILVDGLSGRFLSVRPIVMPSFRAGYISPRRVQAMLASSDNWILTGASLIRADAIKAGGNLDKELGTFADGYLVRKIALTRGYCYAPRLVAYWSIFSISQSRVAALDPARSTALRELAKAKIAADPVFPAWYPARLAARWRFAAARLALQEGQTGLPAVIDLGVLNKLDRNVIGVILAIAKGRLGRLGATVWLFLRFRPYRLHEVAATFLFRTLVSGTYAVGKRLSAEAPPPARGD